MEGDQNFKQRIIRYWNEVLNDHIMDSQSKYWLKIRGSGQFRFFWDLVIVVMALWVSLAIPFDIAF